MTDNPKHFGKTAEIVAEQYLRQKGYQILDRNVRSAMGGLDLIVSKADTVVFVEVKARRTASFGGVVHAIDQRKERRLVRLAASYLARRKWSDRACRFDVILCHGEATMLKTIEHIEDAFEVPGDDLRW
ncbi:MAG: YraN family protein [Nitrospirales bacterium]|nr:YraN family protein [Nitrospirales bacterium]